MNLKSFRIKDFKALARFIFLTAIGVSAAFAVWHKVGHEERYKPLLTDVPGISKKYSVHGVHAEAGSSLQVRSPLPSKSKPQPQSKTKAEAPLVRKAAAFPLAVLPVPVQAPAGPRVVIVLDDWGYNLNAYSALKEIDEPLTLSVLPYLPYSQRIARDAVAEGHEVILHMPMEAKRSVPQEKKILLTTMSDADIRATLMDCLRSLPQAKGVSNHQGSKASEDPLLVRAVLSELKSKGYFYLDSVTSEQTVVGQVSKELVMLHLKRDVFLDNELSESAIQKRFDELRAVAKRNGVAVGVGHDKPITLEMLKRNLPAFKNDGIRVVPLSDLVQTPSRENALQIQKNDA